MRISKKNSARFWVVIRIITDRGGMLGVNMYRSRHVGISLGEQFLYLWKRTRWTAPFAAASTTLSIFQQHKSVCKGDATVPVIQYQTLMHAPLASATSWVVCTFSAYVALLDLFACICELSRALSFHVFACQP